MDPSWMEDVLDSIRNYELQTKQLFEQQETLVQQRLKEITPNMPPAKRRKASKQCNGADGKENIFTGATAQKQQSNSAKINSSRRQMKRVVDSNSWERVLNPCSVIHSEEIDERRPEMIVSQQETSYYHDCGDGGQLNEVELSNVAISSPSASSEKKTSLSSPKLVPGRGRKRSCVIKGGKLSSAADARESLDIVPGTERLQKANDDPESPRPRRKRARRLDISLVPARVTRARAKILANCDENLVDAQTTEPVKKPRVRKGRVPQANSVSEVDESVVKFVPDVQAVDENVTRIEKIPDVNVGQSAGADGEHMNQDQDVGPAAHAFREQPVENPRVQKGRSKAMSKCATTISEEEKRGVANLSSPERTPLVDEADQVNAERQSGGADDLRNQHIKNLVRDVGITGVRQEEKPIEKPSPQQGCAEAALKKTCTYENANVAQAHVPLLVGGDSRVESMQEDGGRQSVKANVYRDEHEHTDDVAKEGTHTVIAQEEEPLKEHKAKRARPKANLKTKTAISDGENRIRGLAEVSQFLHGKQLGHEPNGAEREFGEADGLRNGHIKNLVRDDGITVSAQEEQPVEKSSPLQGSAEAALKTKSICEEPMVPQGVAQVPLVLKRDSRIDSTHEDGERQSEKAEVVRKNRTEDVANGGITSVTAEEDDLVTKPTAKEGRAKAVSKATISSRQKVNRVPCSDDMQLAREEDPSTELMHAKGDRHYGVADFVSDKVMKDLVSGAKPGSKSTRPSEVEENADQAITSARCTEADDVRIVELQAGGKIHRERAQDARVEALMQTENEEGIVTVQEWQAVFGTDGELKRSRDGRRHKGSAKAVSNASLSKVGHVTESLLDVQSAGDGDVRTQSSEEFDDQYNGGVEDACTKPTREDEDDLLSSELDSERWEDIKRSVKVRKGRGKAVSDFVGYADGDLFPLRNFDMALEQERNETPAEDLKGFMQTARPFSDLLRKLDAAALASTQKNPQRELELGGGRKDDNTDGRQSGVPRGEVFEFRKLNISEEVSADVVKERETSDVIDEPPMRSGKKLVGGVPASGSVLDQVCGDIGGGASLTPKAVSQGPGPILESLESSAGALVSGRGLRHLVKELKLELENTEPRRVNPEFVIDLFPGDESVNAEKTLQENPRPVSVFHRERGNNGNQAGQTGDSTDKGKLTEWTAEVTGSRKLVLEGDDNLYSHNTQGVQLFVNVQEVGRDGCTTLEALEPDVVSEIEKFTFVALEQLRSETEYQRCYASPDQETGLTGIKLRIRPLSEFCDSKVSSQKRDRSVRTSFEGGEGRKSDENYAMVLLDHEEPSTPESSKSRNFSLVVRTPTTRGKGEPSNPAKEVFSGNYRSTNMTSTTSRVHMATGGEFDQHRHEAEAHNVPSYSSYEAKEGAYSTPDNEHTGDGSSRRTKVRRTEILDTACCSVDDYVHHSDIENLQCKSNYAACGIGDSITSISSFRKTCIEMATGGEFDQHRHEAEAHNVPGYSSYEEKEGAYSTHDNEHTGDGSSRRTKVRRTEILDTACCSVEDYFNHSDIENLQCKSNYGACGRGESITSISSFGKTCIEMATGGEFDQHRHEAEVHNVPGYSSYEEREGAYSTHDNEHTGDGSSRRTKARCTVEILDTACCSVEDYVHHSDIENLQCKSDYGACGIGDSITSISSFGKTCIEDTSTQSCERPRTNSNIVNPYTQTAKLLSNVRTLIPVSQRPAPTFIPNGKRDVKVKALEAAEAARRVQEKREIEKRERMLKRAEAIAKRAMEKEKSKEEFQKAEQESRVSQKAVSDSNTGKDLSALAGKSVLTDSTNSKSLHSPKSKSTRALALKTKIEQEKAKKLEEELKKKEEERKKKEAEVLAQKRRKEEAEKKEREEKRRRQEEMLKQRKEQEERLRAELEEKEHRHRVLEEAERERKALEEEARRQRRAEREKERERRHKEELEAKAARLAEKEAERRRKEEAFLTYKASEEHDHRVGESIGAASTGPRLRSQQSAGLSNDKLRASNVLSTGPSLSFSRGARVPSTALEGRTHMMATPMVQNKGPNNALPAIKMQSLGTAGKNLEMDHCSKPFATPTLAAVEHGDLGPQSYEISPYRPSSDEEDEEKRPKKFIPAWASKENLLPQLLRQLTQDPDEIFAGTKTCSLKDVFGTNGSKKVLDFGRRSGSGDWVKDRVSWKEELQYKIDMGYMTHIH